MKQKPLEMRKVRPSPVRVEVLKVEDLEGEGPVTRAEFNALLAALRKRGVLGE